MSLPATNEQVLNNSKISKDRFFLLARMEQSKRECILTIAADDPCVAIKKEDQQQIEEETGKLIPWRKDWDRPETRAEKHADLVDNSLVMIGAGGIFSYQIGDEEPRTVLFEKTGGPSAGRMAQASGLADENPLQTLWTELAEETGVLIVDRRNQTLKLVVIEPEEECDPAFANRAEQRVFFDRMAETKRSQIDTIRSQLPEELQKWKIETVSQQVGLSPEDDPYLDFVTINLPDGGALQTRAIVSYSDKTANLNILRPARLELPEGTEVICVDPEQFKRPTCTFTRADMLTPDFVKNKSSVPMRPYLTEVRAAEVNLAQEQTYTIPDPIAEGPGF